MFEVLLKYLSDTLMPMAWTDFLVLLLIPFLLACGARFILPSKETSEKQISLYKTCLAFGLIAFLIWCGFAVYVFFQARQAAEVSAVVLLLLFLSGIGYGLLLAITAYVVLIGSEVLYVFVLKDLTKTFSTQVRYRRAVDEEVAKQTEALRRENDGLRNLGRTYKQERDAARV